jgi:hypothetical protein
MEQYDPDLAHRTRPIRIGAPEGVVSPVFFYIRPILLHTIESPDPRLMLRLTDPALYAALLPAALKDLFTPA